MIYKLVITETAELHVIDACIYYEEQQPGLSERFLNELHLTYRKIAAHPQYYSYISSADSFRDIRLSSFPFLVIYEVLVNEVVVVAVFNTNRKPIY